MCEVLFVTREMFGIVKVTISFHDLSQGKQEKLENHLLDFIKQGNEKIW
jgi:hypothetical protein